MNKKILIIDDNAGLVEIIKNFLSRRGYEVLTALNGNEAMKILETTNPDLLILDVTMPEKDGLEVFREIRTIYGHSKFPVLIMTGHEELKETFTEIEADGFLSKPFELAELEARLRFIFMKCDKPQVVLLDNQDKSHVPQIIKVLEKERFRTVVIETLEGFRELLKTESPSYIFIEYLREEMNGDNFIREVKKIQKEASKTTGVFILVYSYSGLDFKAKSLEAGADKYLGNPSGTEIFLRMIRECKLEKKKTQPKKIRAIES